MKITLKTFADYREITGIREVLLDLEDGTTMGGLLANLTDRYPRLGREMFHASGNLKEFIILLVNGRNVDFLEKLHTRLEEGDVVALFPPVAGG
jgi:sulfur-carrier protein